MINEVLNMLFLGNSNKNSRQEAKRRLQLVIAHDRASINPELVSAMREEILDVVARYVDIDREQVEFGLENSDRITALIASLPIRQVKRTIESKNSPDVDTDEAENQEYENDEIEIEL